MLAHLAMTRAFQVPAAGQTCALPCGLLAPERVLVLADAAVHHQQLRSPGGSGVDGHRHMANARRGRRIASGACREQAASLAAEAEVQAYGSHCPARRMQGSTHATQQGAADWHHGYLRHLGRSGATPWCF